MQYGLRRTGPVKIDLVAMWPRWCGARAVGSCRTLRCPAAASHGIGDAVRNALIGLVLVACGPKISADGGDAGGGSDGSGSDGGTCVPATCTSAHASCGTISDRCGAMVECGSCGDNSRCIANQCTAVNQMSIALFDSLIVNADGSTRLTAV